MAGIGDTRTPPEFTRRYGVEELHSLTFLPPGDNGRWLAKACVAIQIPEATDKLESAIVQAVMLGARFIAVCDTADQAQDVIKAIQRLAPGFQRDDPMAYFPHAKH